MNENYMKVIEALGRRISELETDVMLRDYEIKNLKEKLEDAEKEVLNRKEN